MDLPFHCACYIMKFPLTTTFITFIWEAFILAAIMVFLIGGTCGFVFISRWKKTTSGLLSVPGRVSLKAEGIILLELLDYRLGGRR